MDDWYFEASGKQHGPVTRDEILEKIKTGVLLSSSLAWKHGFKEWKAISEIEELSSELTNPPPLPKSLVFAKGADEVRGLFARFIAKNVDCQFGIVIGLFVNHLIKPEKFVFSFLIVMLSVVFVLYFFDVILKTKSPGRWLLGINVTPISGANADYAKRFSSVLSKGNGFFIPVVSFVFQLISFFRIKEQGCADWDKNRFNVDYGGLGRLVGGLVVFVLLNFGIVNIENILAASDFTDATAAINNPQIVPATVTQRSDQPNAVEKNKENYANKEKSEIDRFFASIPFSTTKEELEKLGFECKAKPVYFKGDQKKGTECERKNLLPSIYEIPIESVSVLLSKTGTLHSITAHFGAVADPAYTVALLRKEITRVHGNGSVHLDNPNVTAIDWNTSSGSKLWLYSRDSFDGGPKLIFISAHNPNSDYHS